MKLEQVMQELESLASQRTKKIYLSNGAREPLFGVATGAMKPLSRVIKMDQDLAEALYATGNYDAMYFAGIIADPLAMTQTDFNRWLDQAYFYMLSDFVVAVTLTESPLRQDLALEWIHSDQELVQSAGWSTYCWSLGRWKDQEFDPERILQLLNKASQDIHTASLRAQASMANFIHTVGLSYLPLHDQALSLAKEVGPIQQIIPGKKAKTLSPYDNILKDIERGRIGFKRKYVRC